MVTAADITLNVTNYAGKYRSAPAPTRPAGTIQTFDIENTSASSAGLMRFGLAFERGQMPALVAPVIKRSSNSIAAQYDERVFWDDGSLKYCVCSIRDTDFTNLESRSYSVETEYAEWDDATSATIADVTGATDFNIAATNRTRGGVSASNLSQSFNATTGHELIHSGPVCDTWTCWERFSGDSSIKVEWLVTRWKDAGGNSLGIEVGASLKQNDWADASKDIHVFDCALTDGVTTLTSLTSATLLSNNGIALLDLTDEDSRYCRRCFAGTAPTLTHYTDVEALKNSGIIPPIRTTASHITKAENYALNPDTYTPSSSHSHRADVGATGYYMGYGSIPDLDHLALLDKSAARQRKARVNGLTGMHLPQGHRDATTNLPLPPLLYGGGLDTTHDSKTWAGLGTSAEYSARSATSGYVAGAGGTGEWTTEPDSTHAPAYSYVQYILTGERYYLDAVIDNGMNAYYVGYANEYQQNAPLVGSTNAEWVAAKSMPTDQWKGLAQVTYGEERACAWAMRLLANMVNVVPASHPAREMIEDFVDHNTRAVYWSMNYAPDDVQAAGLYVINGDHSSPWQIGYQCEGAAALHLAMRTSVTQYMIDHFGRFANQMWIRDDRYTTNAYRFLPFSGFKSWGAGANTPLEPMGNTSLSVSGTTCSITSNYAIAVGDTFTVAETTEAGADVTPPPEVSIGDVLYVVSVIDNSNFQLSQTSGGAAISFTAQTMYVGSRLADMERAIAVNPPYQPGGNSYTAGLQAAALYLKKAGAATVTQTAIDNSITFSQNIDFSEYRNFAYDEAV